MVHSSTLGSVYDEVLKKDFLQIPFFKKICLNFSKISLLFKNGIETFLLLLAHLGSMVYKNL